MQYFLLIYFNSKPLHVSSRLAAHHQEDQLCINSSWCSHALCWLAAGRNGIEQVFSLVYDGVLIGCQVEYEVLLKMQDSCFVGLRSLMCFSEVVPWHG